MAKKPSTIDSARKLASAIGRSHETAAKWVKHPQWTFGRSPWQVSQVPAMLAWADKHLAPDQSRAAKGESNRAASLTLLQKASLAKKMEDVKTSKTKREILEKQFHSIAICDQLKMQKVRIMRDVLLTLPARLPDASDGQKRWLEAEIDQMLNGFAGTN